MEHTSSETAGQSRKSSRAPRGRGALEDTFGLTGKLVDGRYLVERVVGRGGFGVVYRVQHLRLDSPVALKVLRIPERLTAGERDEFVKQFLQEGKLLFRLGSIHPTIVRVFEAGVLTAADGTLAPYLAMDWLDGTTLERQIRRVQDRGLPRVKLNDVITLLHPIVDSLATAHALGVAHLDVKPGNIFLLDRGAEVSPRLLDFGLAKIVSGNPMTPDWSDDVIGCGSAMTPAYAAPEQWRSQLGPTGPWTDVHALALVCLELLKGSRAYSGHSRAQLKEECLDETRRPTPRALNLSVSTEVEDVLSRALRVDPNARYSDAREFWHALCQAAGFTPSSALSIPRGGFPFVREQPARNVESGTLDATVLSQTVSGRHWRAVKSNPFPERRGDRISRWLPTSYRWFLAALAAGACLMAAMHLRSQAEATERGPTSYVANVTRSPTLAAQNKLLDVGKATVMSSPTAEAPKVPSNTSTSHSPNKASGEVTQVRKTLRQNPVLRVAQESLRTARPGTAATESVANDSGIVATADPYKRDATELLQLDVLKNRN